MVTSTGAASSAVIDADDEIYEVDPTHPARQKVVIFDDDGGHWLCDKGVDSRGDLAAQGCWRCGDFPFTRQD